MRLVEPFVERKYFVVRRLAHPTGLDSPPLMLDHPAVHKQTAQAGRQTKPLVELTAPQTCLFETPTVLRKALIDPVAAQFARLIVLRKALIDPPRLPPKYPIVPLERQSNQ